MITGDKKIHTILVSYLFILIWLPQKNKLQVTNNCKPNNQHAAPLNMHMHLVIITCKCTHPSWGSELFHCVISFSAEALCHIDLQLVSLQR